MNKKIVIIDDEEINLDIIQGILFSFSELNDYEVITHSNPKEGLEYCVANSGIEIIFLDQHMPELTGIDLVDSYNDQVLPENRAAIIMISSDNTPEVVSSAIAKGVEDFFSKPFDAEVMYARIRSSIVKSQLRRKVSEEGKMTKILLRTLIHDISNPIAVTMMKLNKHRRLHNNVGFQDIKESLQPILDIISSIRSCEIAKSSNIQHTISEIYLYQLIDDLININTSMANDKNIPAE
jgi:DNA-binding NarL/FixJ family response regulator